MSSMTICVFIISISVNVSKKKRQYDSSEFAGLKFIFREDTTLYHLPIGNKIINDDIFPYISTVWYYDILMLFSSILIFYRNPICSC